MFAEALWWHAKERRIPPVTLVRLPLCIGLVLAPLIVGLPTHDQVVPIAYFLPLVFGVSGALTLREHVQWLRPRKGLLWLYRAIATVLVDLACLAGLILTVDGQLERVGLLSGALLAATVGMAVACAAQEFAWLAAALVGAVCLLDFDRPAVTYLPIVGTLVTYCAAVLVFAVRGPGSRS